LDEVGFQDLAPDTARVLSTIARGARAHPPIGEIARASQLERLIGAGAWTEAALALLAILLPDWSVRRLELDGGEWWCTMSRHPRTPREFDDAVDGRDRLLPLAIIEAMLEARQRAAPPPQAAGKAFPAHEEPSHEVVCCDNFF
jgi:hypothetical protein